MNELYDELDRRQSVIDCQVQVIAERDKIISAMMHENYVRMAEITRLRKVLKVVALAVGKYTRIKVI